MSKTTPWRTARRVMALSQGQNNWYRIRNQASGPTQVHIFDEIGYFGLSASDFVRDIADVNGPIDLHINSPGGEVFDGVAIYETLCQRGDVTGYIDGIAASIASVIAMACNPLLIAKNARMMIHDGFGMAIGNAADMLKLAGELEETSRNIASIYQDHTGRPADEWREMMKNETWFSAEAAIEAGLADAYIPSATRHGGVPTNSWDMSIYRNSANPPKNGQSPDNKATVPWVSSGQTRHEPMTGTHTHDHGAHGASDHDDGIHSHSHSHGNDASHNPADGHSHDGAGDDGDADNAFNKTDTVVGDGPRGQAPPVPAPFLDLTDEEIAAFTNSIRL